MDLAEQVALEEDAADQRKLAGASRAKAFDVQASIAADAAELARWKGRHLLPSKGCKLRELSLAEATVLVEYEVIAAEAVTHDHPGHPGELNVLGVLINGHLIDPEGVIDASVVQRWEEELAQYEAETAGADADEAAERRAEWMREAA